MGVSCAQPMPTCAALEGTCLHLCKWVSSPGYGPGVLWLVEQGWAQEGALNPAVALRGGEEQLQNPPGMERAKVPLQHGALVVLLHRSGTNKQISTWLESQLCLFYPRQRHCGALYKEMRDSKNWGKTRLKQGTSRFPKGTSIMSSAAQL